MDCSKWISLVFSLLIIGPVDGAPSISFPLNSQLPPVARVAETFNFVFSEASFTSPTGALKYSLSSAPHWLQLDGERRTLSGTPGLEDVGPNKAILTAADIDASTDMEVTLVVSEKAGPELVKPLGNQLAAYGPLAESTNIVFQPALQFEFTFALDTFASVSQTLYFSAVSSNNTPLPSWVEFDPDSLRFSGKTPDALSPLQPSQHFGMKLVCSDVQGFSAAAADFGLVVGSHYLTFGESFRRLNLTAGQPVHATGLGDSLTLDGQPVKKEDLQALSADAPDWLVLDSASFSLSGTPPAGATSRNITITAKDIYGNVATTSIEVYLQSGVFTGPMTDLEATIGQPFSYSLDRSILAETSIQTNSETTPPTPWLTFNPRDLKWDGNVPRDTQSGQITVTLAATSTPMQTSASQTFKINLLESENTSKPDHPETVGSLQSDTSAKPRSHKRTNKAVVIVAIVIPVAALMVTMIFLWCRVRKHRKRNRRIAGVAKATISRPIKQDDGPADEAGRLQLQHDEPAPRLPLPQRFSGLWKSSNSLQQLQHGQREQGMDNQIGLALSGPANPLENRPQERDPPGSPSRCSFERGDVPKRISRPKEILARRSSPLKQYLGFFPRHSNMGAVTRSKSGLSNGGMAPDRSSVIRHSNSRLSGRNTKRYTIGTAGESETSSLTGSFIRLSQFPNPPLTVRAVSPESATLSTGRIERYGYSRQGVSPYFGGRSSIASSRPHTWRKHRDAYIVSVQSNMSTIDGMLNGLDNQDDAGKTTQPSCGDSPSKSLPSNDTSPPAASSSRFSQTLHRISRQLSNFSIPFAPSSPSRKSPSAAFQQDYIRSLGEDGHASWYKEGSTGPRRVSADSEGSIYTDDVEAHGPNNVEFGIAAKARRPLTLGPNGDYDFSLSRPATPRLIECRAKRPISVDSGRNGMAENTSQTASIKSKEHSTGWSRNIRLDSEKAFV